MTVSGVQNCFRILFKILIQSLGQYFRALAGAEHRANETHLVVSSILCNAGQKVESSHRRYLVFLVTFRYEIVQIVSEMQLRHQTQTANINRNNAGFKKRIILVQVQRSKFEYITASDLRLPQKSHQNIHICQGISDKILLFQTSQVSSLFFCLLPPFTQPTGFTWFIFRQIESAVKTDLQYSAVATPYNLGS